MNNVTSDEQTAGRGCDAVDPMAPDSPKISPSEGIESLEVTNSCDEAATSTPELPGNPGVLETMVTMDTGGTGHDLGTGSPVIDKHDEVDSSANNSPPCLTSAKAPPKSIESGSFDTPPCPNSEACVTSSGIYTKPTPASPSLHGPDTSCLDVDTTPRRRCHCRSHSNEVCQEADTTPVRRQTHHDRSSDICRELLTIFPPVYEAPDLDRLCRLTSTFVPYMTPSKVTPDVMSQLLASPDRDQLDLYDGLSVGSEPMYFSEDSLDCLDLEDLEIWVADEKEGVMDLRQKLDFDTGDNNSPQKQTDLRKAWCIRWPTPTHFS